MICQTIENGGYVFMILCLFISYANCLIQEKITTVQEFCSGNSFIRNIEPGEQFKLVFKSDQPSPDVIKWFKKSKRICRQEFKTSESNAHFFITISGMDIPSCPNCRCNFFEIISGHKKRFCGVKAQDYFSSKSDKVSIEFHHGPSLRFDVSFIFSVERNVYLITGSPKDNFDSANFIETPYFPAPYPPNYGAEYILQSVSASHVMLLFLDFQISQYSYIEITGNNGTHPTRFYGNVFRPPVIVSQSNYLSLKFQSNDQPGMPGFRALSSFIKNADSLVVPYTDCAEYKNGNGGFINIKTHLQFGLYDCLWHLIPSTPFSKSNLSIVSRLRNIGHKSTLEFRRGSNSKSEIIREINCKNQDCNYLDIETTVAASDYVYIRFNGYLDASSAVNISYSTYHMGDCSKKEFKCKDGRCLLFDFKCDGIEHCTDGSDEKLCSSTITFEDEVSSIQSTQRQNLHSDNPYIYFLVFGCFGLFIVLVSILVFTYRYCKKSTTTIQNLTSGELTDVQSTLPAISYNCDNPPSYDEFVKSSNFYPPLLYTRSSHFIPKNPCSECSTSFCSGGRARHFSDNAHLSISGDALNLEQLPNAYNVEIIQNNLSFKTSKNIVKRSYSLDSKLNDVVNHDTCHLLLSIVHPSCTYNSCHRPQVQWYTLPPNFKYSTFQNNNTPKVNEPTWLNLNSKVNFSKDRRFTWSFVPRNSANSELVTILKTRCVSEPCRNISIHCSLY